MPFLDRGSPHPAGRLGIETHRLPAAVRSRTRRGAPEAMGGLRKRLEGNALCDRRPDRFADALESLASRNRSEPREIAGVRSGNLGLPT
ncbi:MAG TPA: hypothetical protein VF170_05460 [Planctomycetaceae bacterium]